VSTLLHAFVTFAECIGTDCKFFFYYFLQIYNLLYKLSNKQIRYKETLVRSNHPMIKWEIKKKKVVMSQHML
jgi:hypothetical protein